MAPRIREPSQRTDGFSPLALTTFQQMLKLEAQCDCRTGKCVACRQWWEKHRELMRELELPPWCFPCVERPDEPCPFPKGSPQAKTWEPNHEARARWGRLEQAVRKARTSAKVERVRLRAREVEPPELATTPADPETVTLDRD
jgi:hypothetical protein